MIKPDIHLPKSPGISAGAGATCRSSWAVGSYGTVPWRNPGQDCGINFDDSWTHGFSGLMISRSSTAATSSAFLDPPIHFKHAMIPIFGEEFFWSSSPDLENAGCLGGVDILSRKAWHCPGSIPVHPLHWISKTVSPMHMHRHVRKQRISETKQGMRPIATNTDCRLWTSIRPERHHK